jgi:cellulose synthase/poly-beta-1,6-N-acetylglucosamine synthase-like glycosyltransferase
MPTWGGGMIVSYQRGQTMSNLYQKPQVLPSAAFLFAEDYLLIFLIISFIQIKFTFIAVFIGVIDVVSIAI